MKIIGKAEQKKIDLQIETLQKRVAELEGLLTQAKADQKKLELAAAKVQADATKAQVAAEKILAETHADLAAQNKALEVKHKELLAAQSATVKAKQEGEATAAKIKNQLDVANKTLTDTQAQLDVKAKELEVQNKELTASKTAASKAKQEGEAAVNAAKTQLDAANKSLNEAKAQLNTKAKELEAKNKELVSAQTAISKAKQDSDAVVSAAQSQAAKLKQEADLANKATAEAKSKFDALTKEIAAIKAERDTQAKLVQQTEAKYQDSAQENELLLLQLMQAQEELVEYYEQKGEFEKLYQYYKARWERLEKRIPNYLDYGAIEITAVDGLSDVPSITWHIKEFAQAGIALSEFSFVTVIQNGHPGIGLVKDGQPQAFVPKLLSANKDQLAIFLGLGTTEFKQLTAAISILGQLEVGQWKGFEFPAQFDLSFWRPSLQTLIAQLKQLPALLRFDDVRLKRELINTDYEHLWLELHGLSLGATYWKKFEVRLGAALVQADGFSQYPKFEIPLIDGKTKPFDSWYAESQDDSGPKLELRFALDKNVFDVAVWSKLTDADKALVMRVIYAMPDALKRLEKQKTSIHRPWDTWIDFATAAVNVLEVNKAAAKLADGTSTAQAESEVVAPKTLPAKEAQTKSTAPTKLSNSGAKASKVISISTKPSAKTVTKPKSKPTKAKVAAKPLAKTLRKAKA